MKHDASQEPMRFQYHPWVDLGRLGWPVLRALVCDVIPVGLVALLAYVVVAIPAFLTARSSASILLQGVCVAAAAGVLIGLVRFIAGGVVEIFPSCIVLTRPGWGRERFERSDVTMLDIKPIDSRDLSLHIATSTTARTIPLRRTLHPLDAIELKRIMRDDGWPCSAEKVSSGTGVSTP